MEWDVSVIARRDSRGYPISDPRCSSESTASLAVVAESAVPDTSRDAELAVRLSQELNGVRTHFLKFQSSSIF